MKSSIETVPVSRLGRYRLLGKIGAGGMAEVYRAVVDGPSGFSREVVVKRILPALADDPAIVQMLADEARISALLNHPNIVQVHEFCALDDEHFLVMELVDGWDVRAVLHRSRELGELLPQGVSAYVIAQLAEALAYAHSLSGVDGPLEIVHRDVSTSNVRITRLGAVKLLDFGIAKALGAIREHKTRTGTLKGNLRYMSPEQADGLPLDRRSDIFSLGVIFYELLSGRRLFDADTELATLRQVREAEVLPPSHQRPDLDPALDRIVRRMLAKDPRDRYRDCEALLDELRPSVRALEGDAAALRQSLVALGLDRGDAGGESSTLVDQSKPSSPSSEHAPKPVRVTSPFSAARGRQARRRLFAYAVAAAGLATASAAGTNWVLHGLHADPGPKAALPAASPPRPAPLEPPPPVLPMAAPSTPAPTAAIAATGAAPPIAAPPAEHKPKRKARAPEKPRFNAW